MGLLDAFSEDIRRLIIKSARRRRFARREVIFHEGDSADSIHLIDSGHIAVQVSTPLGEVATLDVLGPGSALGELALVPPRAPRSATAVAVEASATLELSSEVFDQLYRDHPTLGTLLLGLVAERNRALNRRLVEALYYPVEARLASRLLELSTDYGHDDAKPRPMPLTQNDLANLAGTSRETASRVLGRLADEGAIVLARGMVTVVDREALARRAR